MGQVSQDKSKRDEPALTSKPKSKPANEPKPKHATHNEQIMARVIELAAKNQYPKAVEMLKAAGRDFQLLNARCVCLMRLGRHEEAAKLYREFVLQPGCTWMRADLPVAYKTNFATSLLLSGQVGGCMSMLAEIGDEQNPTVLLLRAAIARWFSQLSLWQKFNWKFGQVPPKNRPVSLDFVPGDFNVAWAQSNSPDPTPSPTPSLRSAV